MLLCPANAVGYKLNAVYFVLTKILQFVNINDNISQLHLVRPPVKHHRGLKLISLRCSVQTRQLDLSLDEEDQ
jgi:hypothetical protein